MEIKIDINDSIKKSIGVSTKFGAFWKEVSPLPTDIGPALSFLVVLGILPFVGGLLSGIIPQPTVFGWSSPDIMYGIVMAIMSYIFYVALPLVMGAILGALDPVLEIKKAQFPGYATVLAYAAVPAAIGSFFSFLPWIGWLIALVMMVLSLVVTYLGFTEGIGAESGQAIILMIIMIVVAFVIWAILFMVIVQAIFFGGFGGLGGYQGYRY